VTLLHRILATFGIEPQRLRLEWISASEGDKVQKVMNQMTEEIRKLGPLKLEARASVEGHGNGHDPAHTGAPAAAGAGGGA
jgi:hypothetical protein